MAQFKNKQEKDKENKIPFDGFGNVIEMLRTSDPAFREKILRNIAAKDPGLAERLLHATNHALEEDHYRESRRELARSQRQSNVRTYGKS